jgi:AcrR family transcriptional regulator
MMEGSAVSRGGRPTRREAAALGEKILDVATALFLSHGFGSTSIEAVARRARISKRTFYHRFDDKAALYRAVIHRLLQRWLPQLEAALDAPLPLEERLVHSARRMLDLALSTEALALRRLLMVEAERFPELVAITSEQGAARGVDRITELLEEARREGKITLEDCRFAAMQFQELVLSIPLRRANGFGTPLNDDDRTAWARQSVALFLHGCGVRRVGGEAV